MVLQWKTNHPDESLDDIITTATQATGRYDDSLADKGVDKTLYEQWRFVKLRGQAKVKTTPSVKKPLSLVLPDRSSRPTRESVAAKQGLQLEKTRLLESGETNSLSESGENVVNGVEEGAKEGGGGMGSSAINSEVGGDRKNDEKANDKGAGDKEGGKSGSETPREEYKEGDGSTEGDKKPIQKTEVDMASYKAKIALLKQNLSTFNKEKENMPKIEKVEFDRSAFEMPTYEPITPGLRSRTKGEGGAEEVRVESPGSGGGVDGRQDEGSSGEVVEEAASGGGVESGGGKRSSTTSNVAHKNNVKKDVGKTEKKTEEPKSVTKNDNKDKKHENKSTKEILQKTKNEEEIKKKDKDEEEQKKKEEKEASVLETGFAKKIMNKLITETQTKTVEKRIKLVVDDSAPEALEAEKEEEGEENEKSAETAMQVVREGTAKQLVDKWKTNEIIRSSNESRVRVEIKEEDGKVAESVPEEREGGVVRADEGGDVVTVEKGATRGLLNQWQNRPQQSSVGKRQIVISEDDGRVVESEPVVREDVVRSADPNEMLPVEKGKTKSLLNNWQNMRSKEPVKKKIEINEDDGRCVESEPVLNPDVVREVDRLDNEVAIPKGKTGKLLGQWQQHTSQGSEGSSRDRTPLQGSEGEGRVAGGFSGSSDVVREGDEEDGSLRAVQRGTAKNLAEQWQKMDEDKSFKKESRVLILPEDGKVAENEPAQLEGVARGSEMVNDTHIVNKGLTKNLLNQWQSGVGGVQATKHVTGVEGVSTKNLLDQWSLKNNEQYRPSKKEIIFNQDDGHVAENVPEERGEDIVKSGRVAEETRGQIGQTRKAKELLLNSTTKNQGKKQPVKLWDESGEERSVVENEPQQQRGDVCREEDSSHEVVATRGYAKSMVGRWGQRKNEDKKEVKLDFAEGPAVFENQPEPSLTYDRHHVSFIDVCCLLFAIL